MYPYNLGEEENFNKKLNITNKQVNNDCKNSSFIDKCILDLIREAIAGEQEDAKYYNELSKMAKTSEEEEVLRSIYLDELKHFKIFSEIYCQLTGKKPEITCPEVNITGTLTENYAKSIFEELETVEFYRIILFSFLSISIRDWLYEIITDEQAHAQKLNYLYTNAVIQDKEKM